MNSGWFAHVRPALELLYFLSGIAIAIAAFKALAQIKLTKDIAEKNAKRESLRFAAERCQYYADSCVSLLIALRAELKKHGPFPHPVSFQMAHGQIVINNETALQIALDAHAKAGTPMILFMNSLEAFAIPFAAGVADDELGFQETALTFCNAVKETIASIEGQRRQGSARYESCMKLYECWSTRIEAEKMKKQMKDLQARIDRTPDTKIKPVDGY